MIININNYLPVFCARYFSGTLPAVLTLCMRKE